MTASSPIRHARALLSIAACLVAAAWALPSAAAPQLPAGFSDQVLVSGLDWPVGLAFLPDGRLFVCELKSAQVRMVVNGELAAIDPTGAVDSVEAGGEEQGLLSVAVDPRWPLKPYLYVLSTAPDSTLRISRLTATGDLGDGTSGNLALVPGSRRDLIRDIPSLLETHNGGTLRFGPDSMLYVSLGEDARACMATDTTGLFGVVLRLDVRSLPDAPGPPNKALLVAAGNPWAGSAAPNQRLVWARGLRNPFRFHIDAPTGRLFIADVGFQKYEEVDIAAQGGLNFGWPFFEGTQPFVTTECGVGPPAGIVGPVFEYDRAQYCPFPNPLSCGASIIGGVVLRPVSNSSVSFPPAYDGQYLFSDYYEGFLWRLRDSSGTWVKAPVAPGQPNSSDWARGYTQVSDYVLGPDGAVYYALNAYAYASGSGEVRRIVHNNSVAVPGRAEPDFEFSPVFPTPSHGEATLRYVLSRAGSARLTLYDALGRRVRQLVPESEQGAGEHRARWDGRDDAGRAVAPGVYLARLAAGGRVVARRIAWVR